MLSHIIVYDINLFQNLHRLLLLVQKNSFLQKLKNEHCSSKQTPCSQTWATSTAPAQRGKSKTRCTISAPLETSVLSKRKQNKEEHLAFDLCSIRKKNELSRLINY